MRLNMPTRAIHYDNFSPKGIYKGTREEWLEDSARIMADWINEFIISYRISTVSISKKKLGNEI